MGSEVTPFVLKIIDFAVHGLLVVFIAWGCWWLCKACDDYEK